MVVLALLALGALVSDEHQFWLYTGYGIVSFPLSFRSWIKQEQYVGQRADICRKDSDDSR